MPIVIEGEDGGGAQGAGGGSEATIREAGVDARKVGVSGEEVEAGGDTGGHMAVGDPLEGVPHSINVAAKTWLGEAEAVKGREPGSHVVPHTCPRAVVRRVVVGRGVGVDAGGVRACEAHHAVTPEASRESGEGAGVDVVVHSVGRDLGQMRINDGAVEGRKGGGANGEGEETEEMAKPQPDAETE